jgi:RND family efflux transporter MFP subunit
MTVKLPPWVNKGNLVKACAALAIIALACFIWRLMQKPVEQEVQKPPSVEVVSVVAKTLTRNDELPGEIQAYQDVLIYPKVPGFVKWIGVDRGSVVKKDQPMVTMYAPEYISRRDQAVAQKSQANAQLAQAEAQLNSTKSRLSQAKAKLLGDDSTYQRLKAASLVPGVVATNDVIVLGQQVDADKQAVASWEHDVQAAEKMVSAQGQNLEATEKSLSDFGDFASYLNISAPFDGYITERNMHVGSFVGPLGNGAYPAIVRIQQLDLLRIVAPVPERDTDGVVRGAPVQFSVSTFPGQRFTGEVARLGNALDRSTRTMPVELNYNNPGWHILPGMFCKVYWPTRRQEKTLFVPISSVVTTTLKSFVCRVVNNSVQWVTVTKGQTMGSLVEVFGDLKEGDIVAKRATDELRPDTIVSPQLVAVPADKGALEPEEKRQQEEKRPTYHYPAQ